MKRLHSRLEQQEVELSTLLPKDPLPLHPKADYKFKIVRCGNALAEHFTRVGLGLQQARHMVQVE